MKVIEREGGVLVAQLSDHTVVRYSSREDVRDLVSIHDSNGGVVFNINAVDELIDALLIIKGKGSPNL